MSPTHASALNFVPTGRDTGQRDRVSKALRSTKAGPFSQLTVQIPSPSQRGIGLVEEELDPDQEPLWYLTQEGYAYIAE